MLHYMGRILLVSNVLREVCGVVGDSGCVHSTQRKDFSSETSQSSSFPLGVDCGPDSYVSWRVGRLLFFAR